MSAAPGWAERQCVPAHRSTDTSAQPRHQGQLRGEPAKGRPHVFTGRCHGDPFPLPYFQSDELRPYREHGVRVLARRCNEVVNALNFLDAPYGPLRRYCPRLALNAAQQAIHLRVAQRVAAFGSPPAMDGRAALLSVLRSKDLYSQSDVAVEPYDPSRFSVLSSGIVASPLRERLGQADRLLLDNAASRIVLPAAEWGRRCEAGEVTPVYPYWDVRLRRSPARRLQLV